MLAIPKHIQRKIETAKEKQLPELDLGYERLIHIPPTVFSLTHLQVLKLNSNSITTIPVEIARLISLTILVERRG